MKNLLIAFFVSLSIMASAQQKNLPAHTITLSAGRCFNGSGDLNGLIYSTGFNHYFKNKWSWGVSLSGDNT